MITPVNNDMYTHREYTGHTLTVGWQWHLMFLQFAKSMCLEVCAITKIKHKMNYIVMYSSLYLVTNYKLSPTQSDIWYFTYICMCVQAGQYIQCSGDLITVLVSRAKFLLWA